MADKSHILIVDDEPDIRDVLRLLLEAQGYREKKKEEERKPILEISGDTRVRYKNDSGSDARTRVNTTWHIGKTDIVAGGSAEKDM